MCMYVCIYMTGRTSTGEGRKEVDESGVGV